MKRLLFLFTFLLLWNNPLFAQSVTITVKDKSTKEPLVQAHVLDSTGNPVAVTNTDGEFSIIPENYSHIKITAVGYTTRHFHLDSIPEIIFLTPAVFRHQTELIVVGNQDDQDQVYAYHNHNSAQNMDEFLEQIDGISTTKRGAFGWEPVIRGQSDQRMNLVIDGMQVFKACVDKMDPITSYVETSNLSKLQIDKSGSGVAQNGSGNSTVNLVTQKAETSPFSMDVNSSYRLPDHYRSINVNGSSADKSGNNAVRFSGTYKKALDFTAGNDETIENTQYEKLNLNVSYRHKFPSQHSLEVNYIMDKAYDIGYPALLMDATKAFADIGQLQFNFADQHSPVQIEKIQVYANAVRHWMDDYSRDVANRSVMRGMYMPMYGTTETFGTRSNGNISILNHRFEWFFDGYTSEAYGDMLMESLDPDIADMLIYNLEEVRTNNGGLGFLHRVNLSKSVLLKLEENIRFKSLGTSSETHASFFEGMYGKNPETRTKLLLSGSGSVLWLLNDKLSATGSVVYSERMGNHVELFGHYIYNYTDGFFYDGNPWLKTEKTINADLNLTFETNQHSVSLSLFHKKYYNYIDGIVSENVSSADFRFKRYANVGDATITGSEFRSINHFLISFRLENRLSYLYAQNQTLDEPLPLIPPLKGLSMIQYAFSTSAISADVEWAARQPRIAETSSIEDQTDAYAVINLRYEKTWLNEALTSTLEINNIANAFYHTHTSIGNIPEAGRNVMISLKYRL